MKKIAIITITNGENFGNRLQNYAVQKTITNLHNNSYTINNFNSYSIKQKVYISKIRKWIGKIRNWLLYKNLYNRERCFNKFNKDFIKFSNDILLNNIEIQNNINSKYDFFVCGSDQIWNPNYLENGSSNFAQFANKNKIIAFAPSFGSDSIPLNRKEEYTKYLNNIKYISIRENAGKKIVKDLTGRTDVEVLIDPTMLLTDEEWDKLSKKPEQLNQLKTEKYILNYFLGELPAEWNNEINRIAKENNCKVINILDKNDPFYQTGPSEFLYLEKNAFMVCTDSFHSSVFSIIYDTPFVVFDRQQKGLVSMNSRIDTLLSKFKLENRRYNGKITEKLKKCDYTEAKQILEKEKEKSINFLKRALDLDNENKENKIED